MLKKEGPRARFCLILAAAAAAASAGVINACSLSAAAAAATRRYRGVTSSDTCRPAASHECQYPAYAHAEAAENTALTATVAITSMTI